METLDVWKLLKSSAQVCINAELGDSQHGISDLASIDQLEPDLTYSEDKKIPFQFTIKMPPPKYYPEILKRDERGED